MIPVLSREQIRKLDAHAIESCKVPSLELMENAGRGASDVIVRELAQVDVKRPIVIVCGAGNNGGDGYVVARRLQLLGKEVRVFSTSPTAKLRGDARANHDAWVGLGGVVVEITGAEPELAAALDGAGAVVDALLGTGLDRDVSGPLAEVIERINCASVPRFALDIPSGLDADTGQVLGAAIRASHTITFAHPKLGLLTTSGAERAGRLHVADIGVPAALVQAVGSSARIVETTDVANALPPRPLSAHKASAGRVIVIAGSPGKTGAALLVARGALRTGAGLLTIATFAEAADALDRRVLEEMTARIDPDRISATLDPLLESASVVAIGPGFGLDERARRVVDHVVLGWSGCSVVDADALGHFAGRAGSLSRARGDLVLTPHPGELGRLLETSSAEVERDRFGALARVVGLTRAVVLLKGPRTLVGAPDQEPVVNASGTPALATGGAGDVLCGMIAALCCVMEPHHAAWCAAHLHGLAGERWARRTGADRGLLAHEIADELPATLAALAAPGRTLPL
jgi:ADP-dependent NAD(P)H-hydrate dehydratase / NAD(P)H-hydrate epimerase